MNLGDKFVYFLDDDKAQRLPAQSSPLKNAPIIEIR